MLDQYLTTVYHSLSEAEYLSKSQAEKDKYDALIAEAQKKGLQLKQ